MHCLIAKQAAAAKWALCCLNGDCSDHNVPLLLDCTHIWDSPVPPQCCSVMSRLAQVELQDRQGSLTATATGGRGWIYAWGTCGAPSRAWIMIFLSMKRPQKNFFFLISPSARDICWHREAIRPDLKGLQSILTSPNEALYSSLTSVPSH